MKKPERPATTGEQTGACVAIASALMIWGTGILILSALIAMVVVRL